MDFRDSLEFLYGLQLFGIKLGLDNTRALLERAGHPEAACPVIHVAGTNGKGSVCATLAALLTAHGLRTGLYTSPHLTRFTERIRIDGREISEAEVAELTAELQSRCAGIQPTFFEFTTVLALMAFARHQVDVVILETGMGGRLDATNAVAATLSVLTPISLDHQEHLGNDLDCIAAEKAGIIKPGVPVVSAAQPPEALSAVTARAKELGAPLLLAHRDFSWQTGSKSDFTYSEADGWQAEQLAAVLPGAHQIENAALAIAAARRFCGDRLTAATIRQGLTATIWPGRLEWCGKDRKILLDGAHNPDGAAALARYLETLPIRGVRWVVGIKADKAADAILAPLWPLTRALYATVPPAVVAVAPQQLADAAGARGIAAAVYSEPADALICALADCAADEIVLVAGSLYLIGALRPLCLNGASS